jgi:hypothetical protein
LLGDVKMVNDVLKNPDELLSFEDAAKELGGEDKGITVNTIKKWILKEDNPLVVTELSANKRFIKRSDLDKFVKGSSNAPVAEKVEVVASGKSQEKTKIELAQEATALAQEELKKVQFETQAELSKRGWQTVKDGIDANEAEKLKIKDERDKLEKDKTTYADQVAECAKHINESNAHRLKSVEMDRQSKERFQQAIIKENQIIEDVKVSDTLITALQVCSRYYNENIIPVIGEIERIRKAVYAEAQRWQGNKSLWNLQQYVSSRMESIENILKKVFEIPVPEELTPSVEETKEPVSELSEAISGDNN